MLCRLLTHHKECSKACNLFRRHASCNDLQRLLLELVHARKASHAIEDDIVERRVRGCAVLPHPLVLQNHLCCRPFFWILQQRETLEEPSYSCLEKQTHNLLYSQSRKDSYQASQNTQECHVFRAAAIPAMVPATSVCCSVMLRFEPLNADSSPALQWQGLLKVVHLLEHGFDCVLGPVGDAGPGI